MTVSDTSRPTRGTSVRYSRLATISSTEVADYAGARSLRPHVVRSGVFLFLILVFAAFWAVGLTFSTLSALSSVGVRALDLGPENDSALSLVGLGGMIVFGIAWMLSLFISIREFIAENGVLLDDAAQRLDTVYDVVRETVGKHCPPFELSTDEIEGSPTLRVATDREWARLIVRRIGPDLYVGWTMWRSRSTMDLVGRIISDMFNGSSADDPRLLEASLCAAMQEVVETAVEKGISPRSDT